MTMSGLSDTSRGAMFSISASSIAKSEWWNNRRRPPRKNQLTMMSATVSRVRVWYGLMMERLQILKTCASASLLATVSVEGFLMGEASQ